MRDAIVFARLKQRSVTGLQLSDCRAARGSPCYRPFWVYIALIYKRVAFFAIVVRPQGLQQRCHNGAATWRNSQKHKLLKDVFDAEECSLV